MRAELCVVHVVLDERAVWLGDNLHRSTRQLIAAIANDRGERSNIVRVIDDFADLTLLRVFHSRAGSTALRDRYIASSQSKNGKECCRCCGFKRVSHAFLSFEKKFEV